MDASTQKLIQVLEAANDPKLEPIIEKAKNSVYHDYKSDLINPIGTLVADLRKAGHDSLAQKAIDISEKCQYCSLTDFQQAIANLKHQPAST